ncbi:hypothetical protein [Streptomyces sp. cg40]|uniref:hypothetical protein n=1 Tax=Streptomyces sp. cg40 TaxID=3419764 RepID=UPI003D0040E5
MRRLRNVLTAAAGATALAATLLAGSASTATADGWPGAGATPASVRSAAYTQHWINLFEDEDGYRTPHPISQPINPSGGIYAGSNYVYCRVWGDEVSGSQGYNHWWLLTDLDWKYPNMPWQNQYISAYGLTGQGNDQANGIPNC